MTDNEIIKALECCIKDDYDKGCTQCPVHCYKGCDFHLAKFALDLINRQNAEIEQLKKEKDNYKNFYKKTEILLTDAYKTAEKVSENWEYGKSKKIKEFAERLKEKAETKSSGYILISEMTFNNLVKEMTGDNDGKEG